MNGTVPKRMQELSILLDLDEDLENLRQEWRGAHPWIQKSIERRAEILKKKRNIAAGQYKIWCKRDLDDWGKSVIDALW